MSRRTMFFVAMLLLGLSISAYADYRYTVSAMGINYSVDVTPDKASINPIDACWRENTLIIDSPKNEGDLMIITSPAAKNKKSGVAVYRNKIIDDDIGKTYYTWLYVIYTKNHVFEIFQTTDEDRPDILWTEARRTFQEVLK